MRIGLGMISRVYEPCWEKIQYRSTIQDMNYGGRLTKGNTWIMGRSEKSTYYMTKYNDGTAEIWVRHKTRTGYLEETIVCLLKYEVDCVSSDSPSLPQNIPQTQQPIAEEETEAT